MGLADSFWNPICQKKLAGYNYMYCFGNTSSNINCGATRIFLQYLRDFKMVCDDSEFWKYCSIGDCKKAKCQKDIWLFLYEISILIFGGRAMNLGFNIVKADIKKKQ